jgi:hypothetical protein
MNEKLNTYFEPHEEFEAPLLRGEPLKESFADLQEALVTETLHETETLALHGRVKQAANEAAGLAWTTPFPLLVFPTLFNENVERVRQQDERGRRIKAKSADLVMEAVV